jgi:thioredoxin 1
MAASTVTVTDKNFEDEVLNSQKPVLVDFWAEWCTPCKMMEPVLEELAGELQDELKIAKLNTERPEHQYLAQFFQIRSIPNMKLIKDGKVIKEFVGYRPKNVFLQELKQALSEN